MKKTTLLLMASATMLMAEGTPPTPATPATPPTPPTPPAVQQAPAAPAPQMMMRAQRMGMMQGKQMRMKGVKGMKHRQKMHSPFLIKHGLPHMTKMVMLSWDDPVFALTDAQKQSLLEIRKQTMGPISQLKKEILPLTQSILKASYSGKGADALEADVKKLGELEAQATIVHLKCIEETKKVLSKDQLVYLLQKSSQHKKMMRKRMR
jgi:hypothetical protein